MKLPTINIGITGLDDMEKLLEKAAEDFKRLKETLHELSEKQIYTQVVLRGRTIKSF